MEKKVFLLVMLVSLLTLGLMFIGCDNGTTNNNNNSNVPVVEREQAGLGKTFSIADKQIYDEYNRSQTWNGGLTEVGIFTRDGFLDVGKVTNGKLSVTLPELPEFTEFSYSNAYTITSNENNVRFLIFWSFDHYVGSDRYRIYMRDIKTDHSIMWILIYADKPGVVTLGTGTDNNTYDFNLVEGWNAACNSGSYTHYVTQKGFENTLFYYNGVGM
jgi:hypothetical protein